MIMELGPKAPGDIGKKMRGEGVHVEEIGGEASLLEFA